MKTSLMAVLWFAIGCGGTASTGPSGPPAPSVHAIYPDTSHSTAAAQATAIGPFVLPAASVSYVLTERTSSSIPDGWDVGVANATEVGYLNAGQQWHAYALRANATGTVAASDDVPADTYYLVVSCNNIVEDCVYSFQVSATY